MKMFVLDEADEMLSRGFKDSVYEIFRLVWKWIFYSKKVIKENNKTCLDIQRLQQTHACWCPSCSAVSNNAQRRAWSDQGVHEKSGYHSRETRRAHSWRLLLTAANKILISFLLCFIVNFL